MINKKNNAPLALLMCLFILFSSSKPLTDDRSGIIRVMMETNMGTIKIQLYNETPLHRDNFVKLVKAHYYDSLLFHRVIQSFMIQGGDPDSKTALPEAELGNGSPGYTIPAEFNSKLFHKKGVIAAARDGDLENNPKQESSGSQFYIVQGMVYNDSLLGLRAKRITRMKLFNQVINRPENKIYLEKYSAFNQKQQVDSVKYIYDIINKMVDAELPGFPEHKFTQEQIQTYRSIGGTPHLDGSYTVFGEIYEGFEVIDRIAEQPVGKAARPQSDIRIIKVSIIQ